MKRRFALFMPAFLVTAFLLNACQNADAPDKSDTIDFVSTLNGAAVIPSTPSTATGNFTGTYNKVTKALTYNVTYSGVTPISATINEAPTGPGSNGPTRITLTTASPISGTTTLNQALENALIEGRLYVNLRTAQYDRGEIRGYILRKGQFELQQSK